MSVPLVALDAAPADVAQALDQALRTHGFFAVTRHGLPAPVLDAAFEASHRFFALAEEHKRRWHIDGWAQRAGWVAPADQPGGVLQRGFDPVGWQALDPAALPDLKESFYLGVEALGPNQWPDEALVPGFRAAVQAYAAQADQLARRLMGLFELALGLPAGHFDAFMRHPTCTTRLLHYPPQAVAAATALAGQGGQLGCGAHTDWGALTLLAQDDAGGLQVQHLDGRWLDLTPLPGSLVVNIGDMMQRWTNDRWRSTPHRVVNRVSGRDRWSIAYFFDLDADAVIAPLAPCVAASEPPRYAPITAGEHLAEMLRRTTVGA